MLPMRITHNKERWDTKLLNPEELPYNNDIFLKSIAAVTETPIWGGGFFLCFLWDLV